MTEEIRFSTDDELLSAYLDGELPVDRAAELEQRLRHDAALRHRLDRLEKASAAVHDAYGRAADEPMPRGVLDLLNGPAGEAPQGADVVDLMARRPSVSPRRMTWPAALAAGVALAVGIGLGQLMPFRADDDGLAFLTAGGAFAPGSRLHAALETGASGTVHEIADELSARPVLSFAARDGGYCRQFDVAGARVDGEALACRRDGRWQLEALSILPKGSGSSTNPVDGAFRPAGREDSAIDAAIDERIAGDAFDAASEAALISNGWTGL